MYASPSTQTGMPPESTLTDGPADRGYISERRKTPEGFPLQALAKGGRGQAPQWLKSLLNDVGYGILLLDPELRLCYCNDSAKQVLNEVGLGKLLDGALPPFSPGRPCQDFYAAARLAAAGQRKLIMLGRGENQFAAALSPIKLNDQGTEGGVLVTTERKTICESISLWAYGRVQGLTASEIRVLEHLSGGMEPKFIATTLSVSVTTVRTHIKSMIDKTDSSNMRDLLLKISRLPPIRTMPCFGQE